MISINSSCFFAGTCAKKCADKENSANVEVNHQPRKVGKSNYTISKYFSLALNFIINYSVLPLLIVGIFGVIISIISFCYGLFIIGRYLIDLRYSRMGWNAVIVALTSWGNDFIHYRNYWRISSQDSYRSLSRPAIRDRGNGTLI